MHIFPFLPFCRSKRAAAFFATLAFCGPNDFVFFAASPFFADLPRSAVFAQTEAPEWDALLERRDGWLAADGIYSVELGRDVADGTAVKVDANSPISPKTLFIFSDTFGGSTRNDGRDFGERTMTNHSFAVLTGTAPEAEKIGFFWRRDAKNGEFAPIKEFRKDAQKTKVNETSQEAQNSEEKPSRFAGVLTTLSDLFADDGAASTAEKPERLAPRNPLGVNRWLQDGVVWRDRVWLSAILVGDAWKPERIDAVSIGLDANGSPDFDDVRINETAPLSFRTETAQVVFGAAINDDADDGFLYVFGYLDRFDVGSRKDLVVARAPRASFGDFSTWRYFDGNAWSPNVADAARPEAGLVERVSTEFSVSKIPSGANAGRYLLVYTPGVIGDEIAFRVGDAPWGPFGPETVFYRSTVPQEFERGVRCYNAKAHPAFGDDEKILVSYNVNRLGTLARRPAEYRPRFVWLRYSTVDAATVEQR